ncbi:hypothetical protein AAEH84_06895 [Shewanella indica]|uniref:hypothetical protein n=1 Tax=Shewanella TaxID=22 RepID=UPI0006D0B642|nr:hypothetical protein [Shewanella algae]MDO8253172.1 hypothetical protein [Shewanella algae]
MEPEIALRLATAVLGIFGAAKIVYDFSLGSRAKLREEYRFAKEFFNDLNQKPKPHPFVIEKGYLAIARTDLISEKEIDYILSLENPSHSLKAYILSRKYLSHLDVIKGNKIEFSEKYKNRWSRTWRKAIYITLYVIFGFLSMSPLIFNQYLESETNEIIYFSVITLPAFGWIALKNIYSFTKIYRAEKLVDNQKKHTNLISSPSNK